MIRDDYSGYSSFYLSPDTTAETAAHVLLDCHAALGITRGMMPDGSIHFNNGTILQLTKGLHASHNFTRP